MEGGSTMTDQAVTSAEIQSGNEHPTHVSAEEYLATYAHDHYEWDNGELIKISRATNQHNNLVKYLTSLFSIYFGLRAIGVFQIAPFLMRVDSIGLKREPDLQIILNDNPGEFTETAMIGPADICIEIVSPESIERDYGTKLKLYESAGVKEYWLLDYLRRAPHFYRLNEKGLYILQSIESGIYQTPLLPGLRIDVATLWSDPLPDAGKIVDAIRVMLGESAG
jgi:Uma2 family endonuclease